MRVKLRKNKQKELILLAKNGKTWKELANDLKTGENYIANDLKNERILLSKEMYNKICKNYYINYDKEIIEELKDNWGKSKGGTNSKGSTIKIRIPKKSKELAEFIGAILGDGNINYYKKGSKIGVYQVKIAGDYKLDKAYHLNYLKQITTDLFRTKVKERVILKKNERFLVISSKELVIFLQKMNLQPGNKMKNQTTIPEWIWENEDWLKSCIRGLIDTDGSIFRMSTKNPNLLRIGFTNHNKRLLEDTHKAFIKTGFHPSKIIKERHFYISRQGEIEKYLKEVGFSNKKHQDRFLRMKASSSSWSRTRDSDSRNPGSN